jgi:hypothetical protein
VQSGCLPQLERAAEGHLTNLTLTILRLRSVGENLLQYFQAQVAKQPLL